MRIIKHKFIDHIINPETEILIIGTFNPDTERNPAEFFYGRDRNFLWRLLPAAFEFNDLKEKSKAEKIDFIHTAKIDFVDLIYEVAIDEGQEVNYEDAYLDSRVTVWQDVISQLKVLKKIRKVGFTRKTLADIPAMKSKIEEIKAYCDNNRIHFQHLTTPARFYRADKQEEWTTFLKS